MTALKEPLLMSLNVIANEQSNIHQFLVVLRELIVHIHAFENENAGIIFFTLVMQMMFLVHHVWFLSSEYVCALPRY
jgi:hypothetical protein